MPGTVSQSRSSGESLIATFELGTTGVFGIDATLIQEVAMVGGTTRVHHAACYVEGIRNLRGKIITVIDLSQRLGSGKAQRSAESRILIVDCNGEPVGLLVDRVADAISLEACELEPAPSNMPGAQLAAIQGVFRKGDRLVALLDMLRLLSIDLCTGRAAMNEESKVGQA